MTTKTEMNKNKLGGGYTCKACGKYHSTTVRCTCNNTAPESQAHLLTEKGKATKGICRKCGIKIRDTSTICPACFYKWKFPFRDNNDVNCGGGHSRCEKCGETIFGSSLHKCELASQPPVMEGNSSLFSNDELAVELLARYHSNYGRNNQWGTRIKVAFTDGALWAEKKHNQKTSSLQDEIKSLRYDLFHVTASEQSLQSEVEQLKGLLNKAENVLKEISERTVVKSSTPLQHCQNGFDSLVFLAKDYFKSK